MVERRRIAPPRLEEYLAAAQRRCFICDIVANPDRSQHHLVYDDDHAIAFLDRYPTLYGHVLVAPRQHREEVTGDFTEDEYAALHRVVHRVGEAVRGAVPTERLYVTCFGSQQGNKHVHWHVAPLPPGVPFEEQQGAALSWKRGILDLSEEEMTELAERIRAAMGAR
jgi:diadenosine tetraphosphate (Ap4A) HIT family hydrolase